MLKDIRYALRLLIKQPGFTAIAVLTLALGIGATAAVFSLIEGVLLTRPPYSSPDQLVLIQPIRTDNRTGVRRWPAQLWLEWQREAKSFESIAGYGWSFNFLVSEDGSESMEGMSVTREYFTLIGVQPLLGRTFAESDTRYPPAPVVVISYDLWQRKFSGDPSVVGKPLRMSRRDTPPTIIGVMPPGIRFLPTPAAAQEPNYNVNARVEFWTPAVPNPQRLKQSTADLIARVRTGVTLERAQGELEVLVRRQAQADADFNGLTPRLQPIADEMNAEGRRILLPLLGAATLVLLIACGNAAALLLVRGLQRQQEYALRTALGVGRIALFRQVTTESLLLAVCGGAFGIALAFGIVNVLKTIGGHAIPRLDAVTAGWPMLLFGVGAAVFSALLAGIVPAIRASRMDPMGVLKSAGPKSSAGRAERRLLRGVTIAQTALTLALLVGAGLLTRTMMNLSQVASGYSIDRILNMTVTAVQGDWIDFHTRALERVSALPGVEHAAFAWGVPLTGNSWPGDDRCRRAAAGCQTIRPPRVAYPIGDAGVFRAPAASARRRARFQVHRSPSGASRRDHQPGVRRALLQGPDGDRQESLARPARPAGPRDHRRRQQCAHQRSHTRRRTRDLRVPVAELCILQGSDHPNRRGSAVDRRRRAARAALGGSDRGGREHQDARTGSR